MRLTSIRLFIASLLMSAPLLHAAPPELSAEEPLVFDGETQSLLARGDAVFIHDDFTVQAEEIRYFQGENRAVATGNVRITRPGFRLVTDRLVYNVEGKGFEIGKFRAGYPPLFIEGESGHGDMDEMTLTNCTVYLGEPDEVGPNIAAEHLVIRPGERILATGAKPGIGGLHFFRVPTYSRTFASAPLVRAEGEAGYRGNLGAFVRLHALIPLNETFYAGANLDLYTQRGILIGPALEYENEPANSSIVSSLNTGWIHDQDNSGEDYYLRDIPQDRWFAQWRHQQVTNERFFLTSDLNLMSDPELFRDFRPDVFESTHYPDSYVEASYHFDNVVVSALTRFNGGGDYPVIERLPELRADLLTTPLPVAGLYQSGYALAAKTRYSTVDDDFDSSYAQAYYGLKRPFQPTKWLNVMPRVGGFYAHYEDAYSTEPGNYGETFAADHFIGEFGADVTTTFHRDWDYENDTWGINGLRHLLRPVVYWRKFEATGDTELHPVDWNAPAYDVEMPPIELRDWQATDTVFLDDPHFFRFGIENALQTRTDEGVPRELASFNVYQDYDIDGGDLDNGYVQLKLSPAPFVNLGVESGYDTENLDLSWTRVRLGLKSADTWHATLYADYNDGYFNDYVVEYFRQVNLDWAVLVGVGFDARERDFDRQTLTVVQQIGTFWQVRYRVSRAEGSRREDDLSFSLAVRLSRF